MLAHENLNVYQNIVSFLAAMDALARGWQDWHAFIEHLSEAGESIATNLADACRKESLKDKQLSIDYCLGSVLECAACLDVAAVKALVSRDLARQHKQHLSNVVVPVFCITCGDRRNQCETSALGQERDSCYR